MHVTPDDGRSARRADLAPNTTFSRPHGTTLGTGGIQRNAVLLLSIGTLADFKS